MQPNGDGQMVGPLLFFIADSNSSQKIDPDRVVYALKQEVWFWTQIVHEISPESETLSYQLRKNTNLDSTLTWSNKLIKQ